MTDSDTAATSFADVAEKYAPLIYLHDEEKLRPCSADWFIEHSSLRWATGTGIDGTAVPDADDGVDPSRLGAASRNPYSVDGHPREQPHAPAGRQLRAGRRPAGRAGLLPSPARGQVRARRQRDLVRPRRLRGRDGLLGLRRGREGDDVLALLRRAAPRRSASSAWTSRSASRHGMPVGSGRRSAAPELEAAAAAAYLDEFQRGLPRSGARGRAAEQTRGFGGRDSRRSTSSPPGVKRPAPRRRRAP